MSIASRIESIENHIGNAYSGLEDIGANLTNVNKNIDNIKSCLDNIYSELPKTSQEGTSITLANTRRGKMVIQPKGNTSQAILPSEYQQVEYIESSGTQYIDTGITYNSSNSYEVDADLKALEGAGYNYFFGWNAGGACGAVDNTNYELNTGSGKILMNTSIRTQIKMVINAGTDTTSNYTGTQSDNIQSFNRLHASLVSYASTTGFPIFAMASQGAIGNNTCMQLFSISIKVNDILVRNFIPCYKKSNNEIGLYDLINNVFYVNQGTGTFAKGNDVPNPNYPQEIKNVREDNNVIIRGKNLFDGELEIGGINTSTGENQSNILNAYARTKNYIEVNSNTTYSFQYVRVDGGSAQIVIYEYDSNKNYIQFSAKNTNSDLLTLSNITKYVRVRYAGEDNSTLNSYSNIQIEEGSTATSYEPYIEPIEKELKLSGKNNITDFYGRTTGFISYNFDNSNLTNTMTYSFIPTFTLNDIVLFVRTKNSSGIYSKATFNTVANEKTSITFSLTDAELEILKSTPSIVQIYKPNSFDNSDNIAEIQLEEGSTATEYEPYYNYELCKIGDYQDLIFKNEPNNENYDNTLVENGWYKKGAIGKKEITSDMISFYNGQYENIKYAMFLKDINDITYKEYIDYKQCFFTHAKYLNAPPNWDNANLKGKIFNQATYYNYWIGFDINDTLENVKEKLAGSILYYITKTPTYTQITETTLINQLESLNRTIIPGGTIIVETESDSNNAQLIVSSSALG